MLNRYPLWKYLLIIFLIIIGVVYALPNIYGEDAAVQISAKNDLPVSPDVINQIKTVLESNQLSMLSIGQDGNGVLVRFFTADSQLKASDLIKNTLGNDYTVALNLAPRTPKWLRAIGAEPMKLGLDLRGGVHFLLDVDVGAVIKARQDGDMRNMGDQLRQQNIRYTNISQQTANKGIAIQFRTPDELSQAKSFLPSHFPDYLFTAQNNTTLIALLTQEALNKLNSYAVQQNMAILNNRVNELGVSEAVVQQQGANQISVDLPGIQDTARAKNLLGKTATLKFELVDVTHDLQSALAGNVPFGDRIYKQSDGQPILLIDQPILRGDSITYATSSFGQDGRPSVQVRLGGGGESYFARSTADNIGKPLAVVYIETQSKVTMINGKPVTTTTQDEKVISVATIQSALGNNFEITGLDNAKYAQNLALLLRSGALAAPLSIVQETTVGPSLGKSNIHKGILSVEVGAILVIIFMALYYSVFGLIADVALLLNVVFVVAIMSLLGATLTLPGIAGIVLTVGMAVDANVLINERIREELRNGATVQASIHTGYLRAFATIVDANVTTLIVATVLFALGSGTVKAFAITLSLGILTSMVTAIFFTRALVNLVYGGRSVKKLSIGI